MLSTRRAWLLVASALLAAPQLGCSDAGLSVSAWDRIDDLDYVLPDELPDGWTISTATLRPGRPRSQWTYRADVFADEVGQTFLIVGANVTPQSRRVAVKPTPPGPPKDVEVDDLVYVFAYLGLRAADGATARQIQWGSGTAGLQVVLVGPGPVDDSLLRRVADQHSATDLDYGTPSAVLDAGFTPVGTLTDTEDVADYTVVWAPAGSAGSSRAAADAAREAGPTLWMNVGAQMYARTVERGRSLPDDPDDAEVVADGEGDLELVFLRDGLPVTVGGSGVEPEVLRALARSLHPRSREAWEAELGDRLAVDEPEER